METHYVERTVKSLYHSWNAYKYLKLSILEGCHCIIGERKMYKISIIFLCWDYKKKIVHYREIFSLY